MADRLSIVDIKIVTIISCSQYLELDETIKIKHITKGNSRWEFQFRWLNTLNKIIRLRKYPKFKFVFDEISIRIVYCCVTGLHSLVYDNVTEHPDTINVLERMNVYQEVVLSVLYRILPIKVCFKFLYLSSLQSFASQCP